jgi:2-iminobutanoate/2-iminopropanoate deaminase
MSTILRATTPEVPEPAAGTWSNCLVADGVAYVAGMTARVADVVKVTIFVTDISQREKVWQARREFFTGNFPTSTLVQVAALADPSLKVEINAVAHIGASKR